MASINVNGIEIAYESRGPVDAPALVLIQGLGMPLSAWPPQFLDLLERQGFRLLLIDNRDIGHSQQIDEAGVPSLPKAWLKWVFRLPVKSPYALSDMARDVEGLLQALGIESAHIVGISMGGMIAQLLALQSPGRVRSLTSLMSTTNNRRLPGPTRVVRRHMLARPASASFEDRLAYGMQTWRLIGSPGYPTSEDQLEQHVTRILERGSEPAGVARHTLAVMSEPNRVPRLRGLRVPTLVIHGDQDPLVPLACGIDTARAIPDADIKIIPGMGHDLPAPLLDTIQMMITGHARKVDDLRGASPVQAAS